MEEGKTPIAPPFEGAGETSADAAEQLRRIAQSAEPIQPVDAPQAAREIRIGEAVGSGWELFKKNYKFLLLLDLAYLGVILAEEIIKGVLPYSLAPSFLLAVAIFVVNLIMNIGLLQIFLKISRGGSASIGDLFGGTKYFWKYLGGSFLYWLIVLLGFILLVIPGIVWSIKYVMVSYLIVDKDLSPIEALKESGRMTQGRKWKLFLFGFVMALIMLGGFLLLGVGAFVAFPVVSLAWVWAYRVLAGEDTGSAVQVSA